MFRTRGKTKENISSRSSDAAEKPPQSRRGGRPSGTAVQRSGKIDYETRARFLTATSVASAGFRTGPAPIETLKTDVLPVFMRWLSWIKTERFRVGSMGDQIYVMADRNERWKRLKELAPTCDAAADLVRSIRRWMDDNRFFDDWIADHSLGTLNVYRDGKWGDTFWDMPSLSGTDPARPAFELRVPWAMRKGAGGVEVPVSIEEQLSAVKLAFERERTRYRQVLKILSGTGTEDARKAIFWLAYRWAGAQWGQIAAAEFEAKAIWGTTRGRSARRRVNARRESASTPAHLMASNTAYGW
jgi:hypothetical protein